MNSQVADKPYQPKAQAAGLNKNKSVQNANLVTRFPSELSEPKRRTNIIRPTLTAYPPPTTFVTLYNNSWIRATEASYITADVTSFIIPGKVFFRELLLVIRTPIFERVQPGYVTRRYADRGVTERGGGVRKSRFWRYFISGRPLKQPPDEHLKKLKNLKKIS